MNLLGPAICLLYVVLIGILLIVISMDDGENQDE